MNHASDEVPVNVNVGKPRMGPAKEIYMYLWYISNTITYRQLGNLFGVSKASAWRVVNRVSAWVLSISHLYIKWPEGNQVLTAASKFEMIKGIPHIIGAIDGTHVTIKAPRENKADYFDRKKNYSLVLQAIVNADKLFIDVFCGEPGSLHDSRVLRRSNIYQHIIDNELSVFPHNTFIIGDSAYPLTNWLIPPFKENGALSGLQKKFNFIHSSTRMVVENTFGLLKARFRRLLHFTEHTDLTICAQIISSCCVMHNICMMQDDGFEEELQTTEDLNEINELDLPSETTLNRRNDLIAELQLHNIL